MALILVVEDDEATVEFLDLVLTQEGYHVVQAAHGQAALDLLATTRPRLVLSDIAMPVLDGRRLCERLATDPRYHAIPRVLMSIWWNDGGATLPCVTAFLTKPFTIPVLLDTVQRHVH